MVRDYHNLLCIVFQLFLLEELRERKYDGFARKIQKAWRRYKSEQYFYELKKKGTYEHLFMVYMYMYMNTVEPEILAAKNLAVRPPRSYVIILVELNLAVCQQCSISVCYIYSKHICGIKFGKDRQTLISCQIFQLYGIFMSKSVGLGDKSHELATCECG